MSFRRSFLSLGLFFPLFAAGCAWHPYVTGTATIATSPALPSGGGSVPLTAIACVDARTTMKLGDRCTLAGFYVGSPEAGVAHLQSEGPCALPAPDGVTVPLQITSARLDVVGGRFDTTIAGISADGRNVAYRFTGNAGADAPAAQACPRLQPLRSPPAMDGAPARAPGDQSTSWGAEAAR